MDGDYEGPSCGYAMYGPPALCTCGKCEEASCGCMFCDIGFEPVTVDGNLVHSDPIIQQVAKCIPSCSNPAYS